MAVERLILAFVLDHHSDAIGAIASGKLDEAGTRSADRGSGRGAEIDPGVHPGIAKQRMLSHAVA